MITSKTGNNNNLLEFPPSLFGGQTLYLFESENTTHYDRVTYDDKV